MPDVSISNTIVQEDLADDETVTVPSGESWDVKIILESGGGRVRLNLETVADAGNTAETSTVLDTVLHDGDTVKARDDPIRIRGWVVRS